MKNSAENLIVTIFFRCTQLSGALISAVYFRLRESLTRHDPTLGHVTRFEFQKAESVHVAPDRSIVIVEDAAVVAGRRLSVVVGRVHAARLIYQVLYLGDVGSPRLAFRTIRCVGERAGVTGPYVGWVYQHVVADERYKGSQMFKTNTQVSKKVDC